MSLASLHKIHTYSAAAGMTLSPCFACPWQKMLSREKSVYLTLSSNDGTETDMHSRGR